MNEPIATKKRVAFVVAAVLVLAIGVVCWWWSEPPKDRAVSTRIPNAIVKTTTWIDKAARDELELRLEAAPMLTGVVVVAPSLELSGEITVCASSAVFRSGPVACVTADQDGQFRIPASRFLDLDNRVCLVGASAPGAQPTESIRATCDGKLSEPLLLSRRGYSVTGTVVDHFGGPVAGARILGDRHSAIGALTLTDDAGRFELWTANGELFISASGYGSVRSRGPLPDSERRIELYPEAAIEGTVWDSDGTPQRGVHVELRSRVVGTQVTISDADGGFRFDGLGPGDFELRAADGERGAGPTHLRVPMGEAVVQDLTLAPRAILRGRIGFASGVDCTDVSRVEIVSVGITPSHRFETEQVGAKAAQYSIEGVPVGTYKLLAGCADAASDFRDTVEVTAAEEITHDLVFEQRAVSIFGHIVGLTDSSERFIVIARRDPSDPRSEADPNYRFAEVTDVGEFSVRGVGEGTWRLEALPHNVLRSGMRDESGTTVVVEHDDIRDVQLIPSTDKEKLELVAVYDQGEAAKNQTVRVNSPGRFVRRCTTGENGACEVGLPGEQPFGELIFSAPQRILCNGEWRQTCPMSPEDGTVQLVLEDATSSLTGRLTESTDGSGVSFAEISVIRMGDRESRLATTRTEEDGSFVMNGLPADDGTLRLKVTCPAGQLPPIYVSFGPTPSVACDAP